MNTPTSNPSVSKRGYRAVLNDSWLILQEFRFFRNLVHNYNGLVNDDDFFDPLVESTHSFSGALVRHLSDHFSLHRLASMNILSRQDTPGGPVYTVPTYTEDVLQRLWNLKTCRRPLRALIDDWVSEICASVTPRATRGAPPPPDPMARRADDIAGLLHLNPVERDLFAFCTIRALTACDDFPCSSWGHSRKINLCAMAIDAPAEDVARAFQPEARLRRYGLVDLDDLCLPVGTFREYLETGGTGGAALLQSKFYKSVPLGDALPLDFHGDLATLHAPLLRPLLAHAAPHAPNVLFYGAPGTGKTAFARSLARALGFDLVEISHPDRDDTNDAPSRATGIRLANENFSPDRTLLLVDEADLLLKTNSNPLSPLFSAATDKGLVNALLDEASLPTIWIANVAASALDESVRRRFDYSIRFDALSPEKRLAIWRNAADALGLSSVVPPEAARRLAHRFPTNAGGIANALLNAKRLGATPDSAESLLASFLAPHCELLGIRPGDDAPSSADYSIDGLNVDGPVPPADVLAAVRRFRAERRAPSGPDRPRLNVLLYGPPGTGKTEFVKFIARSVGAPVALRTASSLLGPYVGETEANIRDAFRDAASASSILFLDDFDGLLFDRAASRHRWEFTQVNELLQGLETFGGVLFAATNHLDALDPAVLRRFTLKLRFDYLSPDGKRLFFDRFFGLPLDPAAAARLDAIPNLAPGDFRTVRQSLHYLSASPTPDLLLDALRKESALKRDPLARAPIGFAPATAPWQPQRRFSACAPSPAAPSDPPPAPPS